MYHFQIHSKTQSIEGRQHITFEEIPYLNVGLLTGQSKSTMRDVHRNLPLAEVYRIVVGGASDKPRAHKRFIHYNKVAIAKMTADGLYNLFIPVHLGGLGFHIYPEVYSSHITETKRVFDPLVSMDVPKSLVITETPLITVTAYQQRFASFLLNKIEEQMELGIYPKKYLSALVDDSGSNDISKHRIHDGFYKLVFAPAGPLKENQREWIEKSIDQYPLTALNVKAEGEPDLQYRVPSQKVRNEFNAFNKKHLGVASSALRQRMGVDELLFAAPIRIVKELAIQTLVPEDEDLSWSDPISLRVLSKEELDSQNFENMMNDYAYIRF
jgi:hypothetical protein